MRSRVAQIDEGRKFHVPLDTAAVSAVKTFVGRGDVLRDLLHYLRPAGPKSQIVAVIHVLEGMGKTQLTIRFAKFHKDEFTAVFWLNGKDHEMLLRSLSSILRRLPGHENRRKERRTTQAECYTGFAVAGDTGES
ncbi:hypothetical protein BJX99DRAFT_255602 [Aspergillus californicus]